MKRSRVKKCSPENSQTNTVDWHLHCIIIIFKIFNFRYVIGDVLLLTDVFEKYRTMCSDRMGLEALHYISLPSLTFDACLKLTKTKLEIIKDIDMVQMLESGIRGGLHLC